MGCSIPSKLDSALEREGGDQRRKTQKLVQLIFPEAPEEPVYGEPLGGEPWEGLPALRL